MTIEVSKEEAIALKRFRTAPDAGKVRDVLLRELGLVRDKYESQAANEETRKSIAIYKRVLDILFEEDMVKGTK